MRTYDMDLGPLELKFSHVEHETERAYLVAFDADTEVWLPKSKCEIDDAKDTLTLPEWLVTEKELNFYVL